MSNLIGGIFKGLVAVAILGLAGPARAQAQQQLPEQAMLANHSSASWKLKLASDDPTEVGSIRICPATETTKTLRELKTTRDEFLIPPKSMFSMFYLDAPEKLTSKKRDRCHNRAFFLVDDKGNRIRFRAARAESPLSNVYVRCLDDISPVKWLEMDTLFSFYGKHPGSITIKAKTTGVPLFINQ